MSDEVKITINELSPIATSPRTPSSETSPRSVFMKNEFPHQEVYKFLKNTTEKWPLDKRIEYLIYYDGSLDENLMRDLVKDINYDDFVNYITEVKFFDKYRNKDERTFKKELDIKDYKEEIITEKLDKNSFVTTTIGLVYKQNEDSYSYDKNDQKDIRIYGVYDGHGVTKRGRECSQYVSKNLPKKIMKRLESDKINIGNEFDVNLAIIESFKEVNDELHDLNFYRDGTTACVCIVSNGLIYVASVGDSEACSVTKNDIIPLTTPHLMTTNDTELRRVMGNGNLVGKTDPGDDYQIRNITGEIGYELTRGFADFETLHMTAYPEINRFEVISNDVNYLILYSDGVSATVTYDMIHEIVMKYPENAKRISEEIVKLALENGSYDNITCIVSDMKDSEIVFSDKRKFGQYKFEEKMDFAKKYLNKGIIKNIYNKLFG